MVTATERQPGDRAPAPGALALVQAFANSRWDLDHGLREQWPTPTRLARWLGAHGLMEAPAALDDADLKRALEVREGLRALMLHNNGAELEAGVLDHLNAALGAAAVSIGLASGGRPLLRPARAGLDGALAAVAAAVAVAQLDGSWARMKACRGRHCGWVFFDHSRNQSGSWCTMSVCGARHKARAYRARRRPL